MKIILKAFALAAVLAVAGCTSHTEEISVMTFNLRLSPSDNFDGENCWPNRRDAAVKMISEVKPDLFGVQESTPAQSDYLEQNLPGYVRYGATGEDAVDRGEANALFYRRERFDLVEKNTFWLSETPDTVSLGWDGAYKRTVVWVRLFDKKTGGDLFFFNTHFDHVGRIAREKSARLITSKIQEYAGSGLPVFVTGDFNVNYDDNSMEVMKEFLGGAREDAKETSYENTFHNWGALADEEGQHLIDHIFYKNANPSEFKVLTGDYGVQWLSDHYPVVAAFTVGEICR